MRAVSSARSFLMRSSSFISSAVSSSGRYSANDSRDSKSEDMFNERSTGTTASANYRLKRNHLEPGPRIKIRIGNTNIEKKRNKKQQSKQNLRTQQSIGVILRTRLKRVVATWLARPAWSFGTMFATLNNSSGWISGGRLHVNHRIARMQGLHSSRFQNKSTIGPAKRELSDIWRGGRRRVR